MSAKLGQALDDKALDSREFPLIFFPERAMADARAANIAEL
jgi:hypothetical protein